MHDALMDKETPGLSKADRELIVVATSAVNDCLYCVVAHGAVARIRAQGPLHRRPGRRRLAQGAAARRGCTPSWRWRPGWPPTRPAVTEADLELLTGHGLTQDDVWDVGMITAFFALSNRLAHFAALMPNPEFFLMGRVPRADEARRTARRPGDRRGISQVTAAVVRHTANPMTAMAP